MFKISSIVCGLVLQFCNGWHAFLSCPLISGFIVYSIDLQLNVAFIMKYKLTLVLGKIIICSFEVSKYFVYFSSFSSLWL